MPKILFCTIPYMKYYNGDDDISFNGSVVRDVNEKINFHLTYDGQVFGYVKLPKNGFIHIEKIDPIYSIQDSIYGVTVVFCAKNEETNKIVIVGWYKDAKVFRYRQFDPVEQVHYYLATAFDKAILLPEDKRTFLVPRIDVEGFGFGQANLWYPTIDDKDYVDDVLKYINLYELNIKLLTREMMIKEEEIPQNESTNYQFQRTSEVAAEIFPNVRIKSKGNDLIQGHQSKKIRKELNRLIVSLFSFLVILLTFVLLVISLYRKVS